MRALRDRMPPQNQLPAPVDAPAVLYRHENLAVGLRVEAFRTGVRFTISVRLARRPTQFPANPVVGLRRHAERMSGPFSLSDQKLKVGVVLADGRRLVATEQLHFLHQEDALHPGTAILVFLGGRGDGPLAADLDYWLTRFPHPAL